MAEPTTITSLWDWRDKQRAFDGVTYDADFDFNRLSNTLRKVFDVMRDGEPHTIADIAHRVGSSEASVSARIRDLRKPRFGAWTVERKRVNGGLFTYRLIGRS